VARLFADENLSEPVVVELKRVGHDVLTVRAPGYADQSWPDPEVSRSRLGTGVQS
jgi:hypothetical protein